MLLDFLAAREHRKKSATASALRPKAAVPMAAGVTFSKTAANPERGIAGHGGCGGSAGGIGGGEGVGGNGGKRGKGGAKGGKGDGIPDKGTAAAQAPNR